MKVVAVVLILVFCSPAFGRIHSRNILGDPVAKVLTESIDCCKSKLTNIDICDINILGLISFTNIRVEGLNNIQIDDITSGILGLNIVGLHLGVNHLDVIADLNVTENFLPFVNVSTPIRIGIGLSGVKIGLDLGVEFGSLGGITGFRKEKLQFDIDSSKLPEELEQALSDFFGDEYGLEYVIQQLVGGLGGIGDAICSILPSLK